MAEEGAISTSLEPARVQGVTARQRLGDVVGGGAKRTFDLGASLGGVFILAPLFVLLAVVVKLSSPGPVFYRARRTGRYGRPFTMYKFRTMIVGMEHLGDTTANNDFRVTRVGFWLRCLKLDELPQLFNVIFGDMSLAGPRPEMPRYTDQYTSEQRRILSVRPGITDYSSVRFIALDEVVGEEDADRVFEERVLPAKNRLRMKYVREQSFLGDVSLIVKTLVVLVRRLPGVLTSGGMGRPQTDR